MNIDEKQKEQVVEIPVRPENGHQEIIRKSKDFQNNRWIDLAVFGAATLILGLFFFYISTYISSTAFQGIGIMAGTFVIRISTEFAIIKIRFPIDEALAHYRQQLICYYETRKYMHFIMAPILLAAYVYGFAMLLSAFSEEQLGAYYVYFISLSWVIFFGLAVLISVQLRKELELLKSLIADNRL